MIPGSYVPYPIRQNKFVDRRIFIDLLARVDRYRPIRDYGYIGLGGFALEDHRLVHSTFGVTRLISIEGNSAVIGRQRFNKPVECIRFRQATTKQFLDDIDRYLEEAGIDKNSPLTVWFDYTAAEDIGRQVQEFQLLLEALKTGDVVRVTVNAHPPSYARAGRDQSADELAERCREVLDQRLAEYMPAEVDLSEMTTTGLPVVLAKAFRKATLKASLATDTKFRLLSIVRYADTHQMLSLTGILLSETEYRRFKRRTDFGSWPYCSPSWEAVEHVRVPYLTVRERMFIDQLLPKYEAEEIVGEMRKAGFVVGDGEDDTLEVVSAYKRFYRFYPHFHYVTF